MSSFVHWDTHWRSFTTTEVGCFVFPFMGRPAQGPLLGDTAEEFLFPDQIKVNHTGPVMEAMRGGHLLCGGPMAAGQDVKIPSVHVIS